MAMKNLPPLKLSELETVETHSDGDVLINVDGRHRHYFTPADMDALCKWWLGDAAALPPANDVPNKTLQWRDGPNVVIYPDGDVRVGDEMITAARFSQVISERKVV